MMIGEVSCYLGTVQRVRIDGLRMNIVVSSCSGDCLEMLLAVLETVYIARIDVLGMNIEVSGYLETV